MAEVELDYDGIGRILTGTLRTITNRAARRVAKGVRGYVDKDVNVIVREYTTDRAAARVVIAHPNGVAIQAKNGALTKAASAEGLEVTRE